MSRTTLEMGDGGGGMAWHVNFCLQHTVDACPLGMWAWAQHGHVGMWDGQTAANSIQQEVMG